MYNGQKVGAVIVAAGTSRRMGGLDKMWATMAGKPLLFRVLDVFQNCPLIDETVVVLNKSNIDVCHKMVGNGRIAGPMKVCAGGARRQDSVASGLSQLAGCGWVVIHDGARPLVESRLIKQGLDAAQETGAAIAAVPVKDTIKQVTPENMVETTLPRQRLWAVQTPQVFRYDIITAAHAQDAGDVTDDAALVEKLGYKVKVYNGSYDNIKITTPEDLVLAECILQNRNKI